MDSLKLFGKLSKQIFPDNYDQILYVDITFLKIFVIFSRNIKIFTFFAIDKS